MKMFALLATALLAGAATAAPPPTQPKLIVAISIDQFSSELFRRYRAGYTGGLKTLSSGIAYPVGYQSHAATETCPGHSTILSGRHPAATGIVANMWFDVKTRSVIYCVATPGEADVDARGPANMRVTTLGDWVKAAEPGARSFAVSGKDRAAITMGGKHADAVYWWSPGKGFVSSRFASPATPAVTAPAAAYDKALFAQWTAHPPALWPTVPAACASLQKPHRFGQLDVSGKVPPELAQGVEQGADWLHSPAFDEALHDSPLLDTTVLDFTEQLIDREKLGQGRATDVLAISLSADDYIGHRFGNGGAEMCVEQAALDRALGRFVDRLKALHVPFVVMLTSDHGASDAAEREEEHDPRASRLDATGFVAALNAALEQALGLSYAPVVAVADDPQHLFINVGTDMSLAARVRTAAVTWLRQRPEVYAVFTADEVKAATVPPGTTPDKLSLAQRFHESYDPDRSGDLAVAFRERTSFGVPHKLADVVATHGSPWDHDRQVPILFWWPGVTAQDRAAPVESVDIAPTLASLVRVPTPVVDGKCLDLGGNCAGK